MGDDETNALPWRPVPECILINRIMELEDALADAYDLINENEINRSQD